MHQERRIKIAFNFYIFQCFIQKDETVTSITKIGFGKRDLDKFKKEVKAQYPDKQFEDHYERYLMVMREVVKES